MERRECGWMVVLALMSGIGLARPVGAAVEYRLTVIVAGAANSINDSGEITGAAGTGSVQAFVYRIGQLKLFGLQAGDETQGFGINSSGVIVGSGNPPPPLMSGSFVRNANGTVT